MAPRKIKCVGRYLFFPQRGERGEWIGVVSEKRGRTTVVLTAGCELTEPAIRQWLDAQIALIESTGNREADVPDMHDRAAAKVSQ